MNFTTLSERTQIPEEILEELYLLITEAPDPDELLPLWEEVING